jgi:undecaprenyl diphosphate synthase
LISVDGAALTTNHHNVFKLLKYLSLDLFRRSRSEHRPVITPKPDHVAVIMDGNGRWANAQGLSRIAGHKKGIDSVKSLIRSCLDHEIRYLTIFAFSSENWNRPENEVNALMDLLRNALETQTKKLNENSVRLKLIGDLSKIDPRIEELAKQAEAETEKNTQLVFTVAVNYGGRWDVTQACQHIASKVSAGELSVEDVNESLINSHLSTAGLPDPDLYIRTSGEYRISNFMLWQAAYAEFYFTDILWPDFDEQAFTDALMKYTRRDRRYGSAQDQIDETRVHTLLSEAHLNQAQEQFSDEADNPAVREAVSSTGEEAGQAATVNPAERKSA